MKYFIKGGISYKKEQYIHNDFEDKLVEDKSIKDFLEDYNNVYKEVEYLIGFVNKETIEPEDEFDKLIYNINKILSIQKDDKDDKDDRLSNLIDLINNNNNKDKKQIARIIFVLLYDRDLMYKKQLNGESFGEKLLIDLIDREFDNKKIFISEYEYVYNTKFDDMPDLEDELSGGNLYKKNRKYNKK
jgi:hypothetical protein